jgi:hypothetical protein
LSVALRLRGTDGSAWRREYLLDLVGDSTGTAMALTVSVPLALGVSEMLAGSITPGLHRTTGDARRQLRNLGRHGINYNVVEDGDE